MYHNKILLWLDTRSALTNTADLIRSPFLPGSPGSPSSPGNPFLPEGPSGPRGPTAPSRPSVPFCPGTPGSPGDPGMPSAPGPPSSPTDPGGPWVRMEGPAGLNKLPQPTRHLFTETYSYPLHSIMWLACMRWSDWSNQMELQSPIVKSRNKQKLYHSLELGKFSEIYLHQSWADTTDNNRVAHHIAPSCYAPSCHTPSPSCYNLHS